MFGKIWNFLKFVVIIFGLLLLGYAFFPDFFPLSRTIPASIGIIILLLFLYPKLRGVRSGDIVLVSVYEGTFIRYATATALSGGRKGKSIKVKFADGSEGVGIIKNTGGLLFPAKIDLFEIERITA